MPYLKLTDKMGTDNNCTYFSTYEYNKSGTHLTTHDNNEINIVKRQKETKTKFFQRVLTICIEPHASFLKRAKNSDRNHRQFILIYRNRTRRLIKYN